MRELVPRVRCDMCGDEADYIGFRVMTGEQRPDGSGFRARQPREIDLCEDCFDDYVQPLLDMMSRLGRRTRQPSKSRQRGWKREIGPYRCQVPECDWPRPHKTAITLEGHLRTKHELSLDEYVEQHGPLVKLRDQSVSATVVSG